MPQQDTDRTDTQRTTETPATAMAANYDSDSSDDANDYTTTDVVLGYASNESSGDEVSHIGGHPIWLTSDVTPARTLSKCKNCSGYLSLLLQLNADVQQHFPHDTRRIYVFSCKNKACSRKPGSIRAFREVRKPPGRQTSSDKTAPPATHQQTSDAQMPGLGTLLFGAPGTSSSGNPNANPFSTVSGASEKNATLNPFGRNDSTCRLETSPSTSSPDPPTDTFADKLRITAQPGSRMISETDTVSEGWPDVSSFPEPYPHFYLDAYPEELDPQPSSSSAMEALASKTTYDLDDGPSGGKGANEKDSFESALDKTFQTFSDIVAQNPEQVLRYEFKGQPLLYSGSDAVSSRFHVPHGRAGAVRGMPRCEACGAQRVFELQLTPYLIFEIEKDDAMDVDDGMEWGTIIVGTCANNCGRAGEVDFREEWLGVQWEERIARK